MTALLALEQAKPSDVFTAPAYNAMPAESRINLREGERMTVHDLLEALLLESANDAAETLAEGVSGSREAFVEEMNARAAELGLEHTSYANPIGLDEAGNYSSARDLAKLARVLLQRPRFARIVDMPEAELESGARPRVVDEPQRPDRGLSVGERREDGLHGERRQRARGLRRGARRRARDQRGARRADRGGTQLRDARPAALGAHPLPPRARARPAPDGRPGGHRVPRRQRPPGSTPRRGRHHSRRPARPAARERPRRGEGAT